MWIDFTSTIFVTNAGHANDRIRAALHAAIDHDLLHTYSYATEIRAQFLKKLVEIAPAPFDKGLFDLDRHRGDRDGGQADAALRVSAWANAGSASFPRRLYHRANAGAAMIGGSASGPTLIGFEDPNVWQLPFPYGWSLAAGESGRDRFAAHIELLRGRGVDPARDICGLMFEAYIGWAAAFIPRDYVEAAAAFAREHDILLGLTRCRAGFGRTGKLFTYEHYGVEPDLIACGKGISSSMPLADVLGRGRLLDLPEVGSMSSTHSANPLACAAGLANLDEICRSRPGRRRGAERRV